MANTIITKNSSTASAVPTAGDLVQGELAVNVTDKRLFTEDAGGNIVEIGTNPSTINIDAGTIDGTAIGGTTPTTGAFTTLTANTSLTAATADINGGTIDGTAIGGTTPAAGAFTTLSASGSVTLSGGTANGVPYLNGSKVLTSGSALTFDGTTFAATAKLNITAPSNQRYSDFNTTSAGYGFSSFSYNGTAYGYIAQASATFISGSNTDLSVSAVNNLVFGANNTEQMRLTSTGLGIGTSSPFAKLQVVASSADYFNPQMMVGEASNSTGKQLHIGYNTTANTGYIQAVHNGTGYKDLLLQPNGGNLGLGIGTSSPTQKLTVNGNTAVGGQQAFWYRDDDGFSGSASRRAWATTANYDVLGALSFKVSTAAGGNPLSGTTAMMLDSSGNVGIGTSSPGDKIELGGNGSGIIIRSPNGTRYRLTVTDLGVLSIAAA